MKLPAPRNSYIEYFMKLMEGQETPKDYDFWCAVWSIGAVVGRRCFIDRPRAPIYFNWYVLICAESGMTRKSTAIDMATKVVRQVLDPKDYFIETKITPEKLWDELSTRSFANNGVNTVISVSELVTFLGREGYSMGLPGLLTDLYDCPDIRVGGGTIARGSIPVINPYITFIAGSTPSWLAKAINPDVIEGGFTSRCIFVTAERRKKLIPWPDEDVNYDTAREFLEAVKLHASNIGRITITEEAKTFLAGWYKSRSYSQEPYARSFESREDSHILRLAGTLALSRLAKTIEVHDVQLALVHIARIKMFGNRIFRARANDLKLTHGIDRVREALIRAGKNGIKNTTLYYLVRYHMNNGEYNAIMEIMCSEGVVTELVVPPPSRIGRPARFFIANTKILNKKHWDAVLYRAGAEQVQHDETTFEPLPTAIEDLKVDQTPEENDAHIGSQSETKLPCTYRSVDYPSVEFEVPYSEPDESAE